MAIKTAILGYGRSGSTLHANPLEKLEDFEITAVCDIDAAAREKASRRFGCKVYEDHMEMLRTEKLDLVVIVTRSAQHCRMACDCLEGGVNVLVTKPWAVDASEAEEMISTAHKMGKMLLPWLPARWGCDLLRLKEIIHTGVIGKVFQVRRSEFTFGLRNDWQTKQENGGGYLLNWGPHLIDQPMQLLETKVKSVYAHMKQVNNPGDVEDVFFAVFKMEDEVTVVSEFNIGPDCLDNWVIQGDRGTIFVKEKHIKIVRANLPDVIEEASYRSMPKLETTEEDIDGTNSIKTSDRYGDSLIIYPEIAKALRGERTYAVTSESALCLSRVMDAVRKSARMDETVHLQ